MRPGQLLWLARFRVLPRSHRPPLPAVEPSACGTRTPFIEPPIEQDMCTGVRFLGVYQHFADGLIDWRAVGRPKLWRYNLHYFDYLLWPAVSDTRKAALIDSWITQNPPGAPDAWEPYPVSLRIVNWVKHFLALSTPRNAHAAWLRSLARQAAWLERNLEREILANHFFKNAKALVFAGLFFRGAEADRWLSLGQGILMSQIREQFLPDGGHYELSPMYHCLCLEDLLDLWNLGSGGDRRLGSDVLAEIEGAARRALDFLAAILMPDDVIPLFNDSAFGIAQTPSALFSYAEALFGYQRPEDPPAVLPDSGYFRLGAGEDRMIIDCGPVSPAYQPGHTHCDMLSYELALGGRPVVVDTGVFDYEPSAERAYCRAARAHNTLGLDGAEQSEIWGVFRVARRAQPRAAELSTHGGQGARFVGELEGFPGVAGPICHRREVVYEAPSDWIIRDRVSGPGSHRVDSWIHLHPDLTAEVTGGSVVVSDPLGAVVAAIEPLDGAALSLEPGQYFPYFGTKLVNQVVRLTAIGALPLDLGYRIRKA